MSPCLIAAIQVLGSVADKAALFVASRSTPPGLKTALEHVPIWTHAHQVLENHLSLYTGSGVAGGVGTGLAAKKLALKKAIIGKHTSS
ncbi:hypothetical protein B9Q03_10395 [Candidatus Marsarchaeota G2 archaeon OSP_D]|jgi:hypothetical protein|uniref:Uncharacterized protein n=2 Tax=Candidatus Marsarchaeota group 2 TaxID=2203771 RepID=A0A2R6B8A5_9ARCH|nr:MAG: hypothetical protein B9Q03_10395 [Candidatus Marsarchaeota G2 archaeon OSP_D]PSN94877.1 MAG: hypothetical protein B9Q09_03720 [Candidatus Marsarchaeota G2 archaeon ECH_B_SAG-C16]